MTALEQARGDAAAHRSEPEHRHGLRLTATRRHSGKLAACRGGSSRSTSSPRRRTRATPSRWYSTPTASTRTRCGGSRPGRTSPRRPSCWRRPPRAPTTASASSRPTQELPFAGHPTLGTCHAWLSTLGGEARETVRQECAAGLVQVRRTPAGLAFAAPPLVRSGAVDEPLVDHLAAPPEHRPRRDRRGTVGRQRPRLGRRPARERRGRARAPARYGRPRRRRRRALPRGIAETFEVRAFFPLNGATAEDPVTGSLNASLAEWLLRTRPRARARMSRGQGTVRGRSGRVHVSRDSDGTIWVGGGTVTCIDGEVEI